MWHSLRRWNIRLSTQFFGSTHCIFALLTMNALHALMHSNNKVFVHCTVIWDTLIVSQILWKLGAPLRLVQIQPVISNNFCKHAKLEGMICDERTAAHMQALLLNKHTQTCTRHGWLLSQCARLLVYEMRGVPFISSPWFSSTANRSVHASHSAVSARHSCDSVLREQTGS